MNLFPPVRWQPGSGATCWMFGGCTIGEDCRYHVGVVAEEVDEFRFRWLACVVVTLPLAAAALLLIREHDLSLVAAGFSILPGLVLTNRVGPFLKEVELRGMAASCYVESTVKGASIDEMEAVHAKWLSDPASSYREQGIVISYEDALRKLKDRRAGAKRRWSRPWNRRLVSKVLRRTAL